MRKTAAGLQWRCIFFPQNVKFKVPAKHFSRDVEGAVGFKNLGRDLVCRYMFESLKNRGG